MAQQDFDNFKQRLRDWMNVHQEAYDQFEESMNQRDSVGYQMIMTKVMMLIPEYQKLIKKKINTGTFDNISDIETLLSKESIAKAIINEFEGSDENIIIPLALCWLYFGKSFERMIEQGEEIKNNPETSFLQKQPAAHTIKLLISKSIKLGLRSKED